MSKIPMLLRDWWDDMDLMGAPKQSPSPAVAADKDNFHAVVDVQQFAPEEITVKTETNNIIIECKHQEKQDEHGFVSREFSRRFVIPEEHDMDKILCKLSSDGILTVTAPKKGATETKTEKVVPITPVGPAKA